MFIKNKEDLLNLSKNDQHKETIKLLLSSVESLLEFAQPSTILSSSVSFNDSKMKINETTFDLSSYENYYLVSFGKASQTMSSWFLSHFPASFSRIIIVSPEKCSEKFTSNLECQCFVGGHPVLNEKSIEAAEETLKLLETLTNKDLCIFLISGGGSALFESPDFSLSLSEYKQLQKHLLSCGASIKEVNTIRKHFSKVKAGKLAQSTEASIISLIISDVVGNDPSFISSGPTVPDSTTWDDCFRIIHHYDLHSKLPKNIINITKKGKEGLIPDTPSDLTLFTNVHNFVIGDNLKLLSYMKESTFRTYSTHILDYKLIGEACLIGKKLAETVSNHVFQTTKLSTDITYEFLLLGGETTVTLSPNPGIGGRSQELALSFISSFDDIESTFMVSLGTDGIDGSSDAAGAIVGPYTIQDTITRENAKRFLKSNDSNSFFKKYGGEIVTGYTGTNFMDIIIICMEVRGEA